MLTLGTEVITRELGPDALATLPPALPPAAPPTATLSPVVAPATAAAAGQPDAASAAGAGDASVGTAHTDTAGGGSGTTLANSGMMSQLFAMSGVFATIMLSLVVGVLALRGAWKSLGWCLG